MKKSVVDKFQFSVVAKKIVAIFNDNKNHKDGSLNKFLCGRLVIDMKFLILKVAIGGVCLKKSEPILSKIQMLIDAKLRSNFAYGSRAKIFLPLNPSNFCPPTKSFLQNFLRRLFNS